VNRTIKYSLVVLFLGICVLFRWNCADDILVIGENEKVTSNRTNLTSINLAEYSEYFVLNHFDNSEIDNLVINLDKHKKAIASHRFTPREKSTYTTKYLQKQNTVVCLSSVYVGYLEALGLEQLIVGVDNLDFVSNEIVRNNGKVEEIGHAGQLNMEALLSLDPKYVFVDDFDLNEGLEKELKQAGIMLVRCNPFREKTPIARAEWIKFFGVIFDVYDKAKVVFEDTKFNYHLLKKEAENFENKPTVFLNAPYGDQWTIPGGNSFQAKLMKDAGANYIFNRDTSTMTIHSGFEKMLVKAENADYWLHIGTANSKEELLRTNANFAEFKAFKTGLLYNNNKNTNADGGIPYWESSGVHPDWVLADLIHIFHPEKDSMFKFHYYQKLN